MDEQENTGDTECGVEQTGEVSKKFRGGIAGGHGADLAQAL